MGRLTSCGNSVSKHSPVAEFQILAVSSHDAVSSLGDKRLTTVSTEPFSMPRTATERLLVCGNSRFDKTSEISTSGAMIISVTIKAFNSTNGSNLSRVSVKTRPSMLRRVMWMASIDQTTLQAEGALQQRFKEKVLCSNT